MSAFYEIDFKDFAEKFTPWFIREYGFLFKEGDFQTGNTNDQEVRFITQARNGHFYQYIRLGVGVDRFLNTDLNKQKLNKLIRKNLELDSFQIENILIVTASDIPALGITDQQLIKVLEQDKYVISIEVDRTNRTDGILLDNDNTGSAVKFMQSIMYGLDYLNNIFYSYVINKKEELKYNGQIIYLQKRLNDIFDNELRRIYIANISTIPIQYLYRVTEFQDSYVYRITEAQKDGYIIGRTSEIGVDDFDFVVFVPVPLTYNADQVNATINRYKLSDKIHTIQTY